MALLPSKISVKYFTHMSSLHVSFECEFVVISVNNLGL